MISVRCQLLMVFLSLAVGVSVAKDATVQFVFHKQPVFVKITVDVNSIYSSGYIKLEPFNREWFILFGVEKFLNPFTYPAVNTDIQSSTPISKCRHHAPVLELQLELELHSNFVRLRAGNSERYEFPEAIALGHNFSVSFFVQDHRNKSLCWAYVRLNELEASRFSLPPVTVTPSPIVIEPVELDSLDSKPSSRRMMPNPIAVTETSQLWTGKIRFATYKMHFSDKTKAKGRSYIDIQNDPHVYKEVQRSWTKEINSGWSITFLAFLTVEVIVIGTFIVFGFVMFILLQIRPKPDKDGQVKT